MSSDPDLSAILSDLASGRIDQAEAARRIAATQAGTSEPIAGEGADPNEDAFQFDTPDEAGPDGTEHDEPSQGSHDEPWRAFAREEARRPAPEPAASTGSASGGASTGSAGGAASAGSAGGGGASSSSAGRGARRVSIRSVGRRVRVIGDASVPSVAVTGPHVLRRSGTVLEVTSEGQGTPLENFSLLKLPRSLDDLKSIGLGTELVVRVNPALAVDAEVTASGLAIEGVPYVGHVRVTAGGASIKGVRQAEDVLVQAGSATVEGPIGEGRSRVKCESGGLTVTLTDGANVTVRGQASVGRIAWPGEGVGTVDEWVVGNGSGRLDVEIVMGLATVREAQGVHGDADAANGEGERRCSACGEPAPGKFCPSCGAPQPAGACSGCGKPLPAGARFCPECGTAA